MLKISAIQCPSCMDVIFSRARHDMHFCSCGKTAIDGGFDYIKVTGHQLDKIQIKTLKLNVTKKQLYDDWNHTIDKYGLIKNKELS